MPPAPIDLFAGLATLNLLFAPRTTSKPRPSDSVVTSTLHVATYFFVRIEIEPHSSAI
jgi:hypothetical protein